MKGFILACLVLLCGVNAVSASDYYQHDSHWYHSNGYYQHPGVSGYYNRSSYYTDGYYRYGIYYPGYLTYRYYSVPYVAPVFDLDKAIEKHDADMLKEKATIEKLKARGLYLVPSVPQPFGGYGLLYPQGQTVYGTFNEQKSYGNGYYTANSTSSSNASIDLMQIVHLEHRAQLAAIQYAGQKSTDVADQHAAIIRVAEINARRDQAIEAIRAMAARPNETTFRTFSLQVTPAVQDQPPVLAGADQTAKATIENDPQIKAAISQLQSCVGCHSGGAENGGRFKVTEFFTLPVAGDGMTYAEVRKRMVTGDKDKPQMPKGMPALTAKQLQAIDDGYLRARALNIPVKASGNAKKD